MRRCITAVFILFLFTEWGLAEGTRSWEQSKFDEFEKGTAQGVAILSQGGLELAPSFKSVFTTPSTYIWAIATDAQGNAYAAAGAPARVYRITPQGQTSVIFQPQELQVQSLLVDKEGVIYAATAPDGKVYKIEHKAGGVPNPAAPLSAAEPGARITLDADYTSSLFFEPKTKYIWDMAEDSQGRLYVATGDRGEIFRVEKSGQSSVFFKSDEAHIRVLAFDPAGNLIAGTDGSGLVYRISPAGEGFVLYSAPKKEITALAVDRAGNIYAAGVGEKRSSGISPQAPAAPPPAPSATATIVITPAPGNQAQPQPLPAPVSIPFPGLGATAGSEIYQIASDGSPKRIWSSREDVVYALSFDARGRLLAGTGNKGRIYAVLGQRDFTDLVKASANQVTAMANGPNGVVYAATSNLGKVFLLGAAPEQEGSYESDVFDARTFSRWGRAQVRGAGNFELFTRSGNVDNPDRNWSPWKKVDLAKGSQLDVPPARFVQWRAVLKPGNPTPLVRSVTLFFLPKNVAPEVDEITVQPGARFLASPKPLSESVTVNVGAPQSPAPRFEAPPPATRDREAIAVRWTAHDDNDDEMVYSLYYRGDGEQDWKLLKDGLSDKYYSFDAGLLPDGGYGVKVVVSDAPSHSPADALTSSRESGRFEVDTTPPQIQGLNVALEGEALRITFRAADSFSIIKRAEYSVDAADWQFVEPVGLLSDSPVENYDFYSPLPKQAATPSEPAASAQRQDRRQGKPAASAEVTAAREHVVVVRVYDRFDNMASAKAVVHGGSK